MLSQLAFNSEDFSTLHANVSPTLMYTDVSVKITFFIETFVTVVTDERELPFMI